MNDANPGITVFPYSMFYHFYEQYDTIAVETGNSDFVSIFCSNKDKLNSDYNLTPIMTSQPHNLTIFPGTNLVICIVAVFIVSFVMLGFQMYPSFVILLCVSMITGITNTFHCALRNSVIIKANYCDLFSF